MKKLFYFILLILSVSIISCNQQKEKKETKKPAARIQNTFFGLKLGEVTYDEAITTFHEKNFRGENLDRDSDGYSVHLYGPITFAGISWENVICSFTTDGIFETILFFLSQDSQHYSDEDKDNIYESLHDQLSKKYDLVYIPADSTFGEYYQACDSKYEMKLYRDDVLILGYGLKQKPSDKGYNSDL